MDPRMQIDDDVLALPLRAELFTALARLSRPATTQELAERVGRHHNSVRVQLGRLADAGLLERRVVAQRRGRPRHVWTIATDAAPGGRQPEDHGQLSRWLARAIARSGDLASVEATGREIGQELGGGAASDRPLAEGMLDALAALGFVPRRESGPVDGVRFVLRSCPYRDAVLENQPVICGLHRGITQGLLDRYGSHARLAAFIPKDPLVAGCVIELDEIAPPA
jgi:predicted ArsR family transcriptional regulator